MWGTELYPSRCRAPATAEPVLAYSGGTGILPVKSITTFLRVLLCSRVSRLRWLFGFGALMSCILLFDRPQLLAEIS